MLQPHMKSRIKKQRHLATIRINACQVGSLVPVTVWAGESKIVVFI